MGLAQEVGIAAMNSTVEFICAIFAGDIYLSKSIIRGIETWRRYPNPPVAKICTPALISHPVVRHPHQTPLSNSSCWPLLHPSNSSELLILCTSIVKFCFDFLIDEGFVVLEILLDVDFELDDIVQNLLNLCVEFLAQGVGTEGQLFESRRVVSMLRIVQILERKSAHSMFVFISRCSISWMLSSRPARIFASSFSIFSICASEATFCVEVT